MSEVSVDSITIDGAGQGPTLVLLHAFPVDHRVWLPCARIVAEHASRIILIDLPGHGRSAVPTEIGLEVAAKAVLARLAELGEQKVVLAGLSMGGYVALACAQLQPGIMAGLALVDSKTSPDAAPAARKREDLAKSLAADGIDAVIGAVPGLLAPPLQAGDSSTDDSNAAQPNAAQPNAARPNALVPTVEGWVREQDPAGVAWSALSMAQRSDRSQVVQHAAYPVSFIAGSLDTITPIQEAIDTFGQAPHVTFSTIEAAGHLSALEAPLEVARELIALLTRSRSGQGRQLG